MPTLNLTFTFLQRRPKQLRKTNSVSLETTKLIQFEAQAPKVRVQTRSRRSPICPPSAPAVLSTLTRPPPLLEWVEGQTPCIHPHRRPGPVLALGLPRMGPMGNPDEVVGCSVTHQEEQKTRRVPLLRQTQSPMYPLHLQQIMASEFQIRIPTRDQQHCLWHSCNRPETMASLTFCNVL